MNKIKYVLTLCFLILNTSPALCDVPVPPQAARAGYLTNTFSTGFTRSTVDLLGIRTHGYSWYAHDYLGQKASASKLAVDEKTQTLILMGDADIGNSQIATVVATKKTPDKFIGTAFGGGAYFEAELAFDVDEVLRTGPAAQWPAFYGLSVERVAQNGADHWAGQPDQYAHYMEVDFFEYGVAFNGKPRNFYGSDMHEWYGIAGVTCPKFFCHADRPPSDVKAEVPASTDFTAYHKYGFLWIPASDGHQGTGQYYFDDKPVGTTVHWNAWSDDAVPPPGKNLFSILDKQHLILILGTGDGQWMKVRRVNVWQASDANNLRR